MAVTSSEHLQSLSCSSSPILGGSAYWLLHRRLFSSCPSSSTPSVHTHTHRHHGPPPWTDLPFSSGMIWNHILQWRKHNVRGENKGRPAFGCEHLFLSLGTKAVSSTPCPTTTASHGLLIPAPLLLPKPRPHSGQKNTRMIRWNHIETHSKTYFAPGPDRPAKHKSPLTLQSNSPPLQRYTTPFKIEMKLVNREQYNLCFQTQTLPSLYCPHACLTFRLLTLVQDICCLCVCCGGPRGGQAGEGDKGVTEKGQSTKLNCPQSAGNCIWLK